MENNQTPKSPGQTENGTASLCWCGCGSVVGNKSFYRPGHDSRHVGQVAREVVASDAFEAITSKLPTRPLQLKAWNMAYRLHLQEQRKERRLEKLAPRPRRTSSPRRLAH